MDGSLGFMTDFLPLIDMNAGGFREKRPGNFTPEQKAFFANIRLKQKCATLV